MNDRCKDCRFYDGRKCGRTGSTVSPTFHCSYFASNTSSQTDRCKDCRFYDGRKCGRTGSTVSPTFHCSYFSPFR